jgi:putative oxidoreductase
MDNIDAVNLALLILRVTLGLTMAAHGYNKFFGGGRIPGTAGWFDSMGMRPGKVHAVLAASTEMGAGLAFAAGLFTPLAAAGFVALMIVAAWTVHRKSGFFIVKSGWEYNLVLAVVPACIAGVGPGEWSLDHALKIDDNLWGWRGLLIAFGVGIVAGIGQLVLFYRPPADSE